MRLTKGKFYDNAGNLVPLEFGNKEQIQLMERERNRLEALTNGTFGIDPEVEKIYRATADFKCVCGQTVFLEQEIDEEDDFDNLCGDAKCRHCKQKYSVTMNNGDEDGMLLVKLSK